MRSRILITTGTGSFTQGAWVKPEPTSTEIEVKAVMTGVCRSDVDMMQGNFGPLPLEMQGHEGLGVVTKVGADILGLKIGDYVATRGEPAYSDYYNVRQQEFVRVPELHPRYILEPVACGINVIHQPIREIAERTGGRLLILGSGFLAWVAYHTLKLNHIDIKIDVVGNSNKELWSSAGVELMPKTTQLYDVVINLKGDFDHGILKEQALLVEGVGRALTKSQHEQLLWKACTIVFPSPRTDGFYQCMKDAAYWIEHGDLKVDSFWTRGYDRNTEWQQAFEDGLNRPEGYSRGYIIWS